MSTLVVTLRLSEIEAKLCADLIQSHNYATRSCVLREGLLLLAQQFALKPGSLKKIKAQRIKHRRAKR